MRLWVLSGTDLTPSSSMTVPGSEDAEFTRHSVERSAFTAYELQRMVAVSLSVLVIKVQAVVQVSGVSVCVDRLM